MKKLAIIILIICIVFPYTIYSHILSPTDDSIESYRELQESKKNCLLGCFSCCLQLFTGIRPNFGKSKTKDYKPYKKINYEHTLYDKNGIPTAYIDYKNDATIFLWNGNPCAYLYENSVYGFNGKHLGWYENGVVYDKEGYQIGFLEGTCPSVTGVEQVKSIKRIIPIKWVRRVEPVQPVFKITCSDESFMYFLFSGTK